jgi:hypothetical protein
MSDSKVSTCPLLQQSRQQCAREAHEQAQKPERVDPHGRYRRRELGRVRQRGGHGNAGPISISKKLVDIREIERRRVLRVRLKVLDGQSDKRGDRGGEQTGL